MSPTGIREQKKSKRYKSIVLTAEKLFLENGLDTVQMQDVADAEGIGIATLFRYFPKKDKLIVAVAVNNLANKVEHFEKIASKNVSSFERVEQILDYLMEHSTNPLSNSMRFREAFESYASFAQKPLEDIDDYLDIQKIITQILMKIIEDGKLDGSIRSNVSVKEALITIINAFGNFGSNIALKAPISYLEEDIAPVIQQTLLKEMLLSYIRP